MTVALLIYVAGIVGTFEHFVKKMNRGETPEPWFAVSMTELWPLYWAGKLVLKAQDALLQLPAGEPPP